MTVYVKSQSGKWLMPTNSAKARVLLKRGKAKVLQRTPFAIEQEIFTNTIRKVLDENTKGGAP